ncbi:TPA: lipid IV(A) 3-deoxy-D-manno-octulosonic acid transferase [Mannheimia haemolytica]|nr:lipid IV(A) 3-deoxy-D-manno-octulosonic acid transferase [Mannheimia haemolytica]HDL2944144.1 lipid IV(A) 3-deoxy-D-manno-octulosonic acid transferase [Mannheimia haemolytica]HDL2977559.1 lipid IV(A) 3-deoxy-D-manno-octulosonic acid transferase [Mannheimia haemolytica]HDL2982521.1 lipid IV(A) 3-deoxy-D-manno-octulosonic acid transferase [Mannheimia haemolytica]HDL3063640.1 lipid IV(A) 3-deoxy-D-manno-octulosonic acid transferase [Mannheimia haemolytica]
MLRLLYICLSYLLQPVVLLLMWYKGRKQPAYRKRLWERYGIYDESEKPKAKGVVIHAASVGEVIAATPLIKAVSKQYPELPLIVTTVTPTGSGRVQAAFGNSVSHFYLPYDLPDAIERFLNFIDPKLMIVIETELWPNLIRKVNIRKIPFVIANARLSPRSAKLYGWVKGSIKDMLNQISLIMAQDEVSRDRYLALGYAPAKMVNTGNLKFDLEITPQLHQSVIKTKASLNLTERPIWIAGSTHEGEEKLILDAHKLLLEHYPNLVLILVPRHPERFGLVELLIQKSDLNYVKRTENKTLSQNTQVMLGDTMGEMMLLYGLSDIAFVGGSLVKHGGHNPLEPIAFNIPVVSGLYTYNFPEIFEKLREVKGVIEIESSVEALTESIQLLLKQPQIGQEIAKSGLSVLQENQGALKRHLDLLASYLEK